MASRSLRPKRWEYFQPIITHPGVKSAAPIIFTLLALIFFTLFVFRPTLFTITELRDEINTKSKLSGDLDKKIQVLQVAKGNLENLTNDSRAKIDRATPLQANVVDLIANIENSQQASVSGIVGGENTATVSGTALQIQPVTLLTSTGVSYPFATDEIGFTYTVKGDFGQLLDTIDRLEKTPRILKLESVTISKNEEQNQAQKENAAPLPPLTLSVSGKGYFLAHKE